MRRDTGKAGPTVKGTTCSAMHCKAQRGWVFDQQGTMATMRERRIGVYEANALCALAQAEARFR